MSLLDFRSLNPNRAGQGKIANPGRARAQIPQSAIVFTAIAKGIAGSYPEICECRSRCHIHQF